MLYILIYIVVVQVIRTTIVFPQRELSFCKSISYAWKAGSRQKGPLCFAPFSGCTACSQNLMFSTTSALACQKSFIFQMNSNRPMIALSKSHWRPRFSYLFDIASTCHQSRGPSKFAKLSWNQFEHIFPMFFQSFMLTHLDVALAKL